MKKYDYINAPRLRRGGKTFSRKTIKLFDIYQGSNIENSDEKSVAYSLVFNNPDRTLTDEEVNSAFNSIVSNLESKFGARLRS